MYNTIVQHNCTTQFDYISSAGGFTEGITTNLYTLFNYFFVMISNDDFVRKLEEAIKNNEFVVFSANCSVKYSGRAESFLPFGDRLVIIKHDGTILVHQPKGSAPVNYMKEKSVHKICKNNGRVELKSNNLFLRESMEILIERVHFFNSHRLEDHQKILLNGTERDMAEMIINNPKIIEEGFVPFSEEERTKYGFIDVFGHDKDNNTVIVECKRYSAGLDAVTQLRRYVEKIRKSRGVSNVRGIIAAPRITQNAERMLKDWGFEFKKIDPPKRYEEYKRKQLSIVEYYDNKDFYVEEIASKKD